MRREKNLVLMLAILIAFAGIGCSPTTKTAQPDDTSFAGGDNAIFRALISPDCGKPPLLKASEQFFANNPILWLQSTGSVMKSKRGDLISSSSLPLIWNGWQWDGEWYTNNTADGLFQISAQFLDIHNEQISPFSGQEATTIHFCVSGQSALFKSDEDNFTTKFSMGNRITPISAEKDFQPIEGFKLNGSSTFTIGENSVISGIPITQALTFSIIYGGSAYSDYFFRPSDSALLGNGLISIQMAQNTSSVRVDFRFTTDNKISISTQGFSNWGSQDYQGIVDYNQFSQTASSSSAVARTIFLPENGEVSALLKAMFKMGPVNLLVDRLQQSSQKIWSDWKLRDDGWFYTSTNSFEQFAAGNLLLFAQFAVENATQSTPDAMAQTKRGKVKLFAEFSGKIGSGTNFGNFGLQIGTKEEPCQIQLQATGAYLIGKTTVLCPGNNFGINLANVNFVFSYLGNDITGPEKGFYFPFTTGDSGLGKTACRLFHNSIETLLIIYDFTGANIGFSFKPYTPISAPKFLPQKSLWAKLMG
ncbi:MAG: hypothetical protein HQM08_05225 [Candidatus Riflebacteria bacterium]|nr:hypothetical protein [Candidatus Riflebacteria bacterium]